MRYLAAFLSIFMHMLFVVFVFDFVGLPQGQSQSGFDIELVSLAKQEQSHDLMIKEKNREDSATLKAVPEVKKVVDKILPGHVIAKPSKVMRGTKIKNMAAAIEQVDFVSMDFSADPKSNRSYPHMETGSSSNPNAITLRQGKGVTVGNSTMVLKRGSEARSLSALAAYGFNEDDFRGHYETYTGRQVAVIDARAEHGRLVLHDRKSGLLRKLKKSEFGDFIYTYGPSFDEDEPIKGSIVFLPGDEHWIHRFMWMPDGEPAEYPVKGRVDAYEAKNDSRVGGLFVPAARGRFPAVVLYAYGKDIPAGQFAEVARNLCGHDIVVSCVENLNAENLRKAVHELQAHPKVDRNHIGIWARGYGAKEMPRMNLPAGHFNFVILTIDHPDERLFPEMLASVLTDDLPTFLGFRSVSGDWKRVAPLMLTGFQSAPHQIVMIDEPPCAVEGIGAYQDWIDCLSGDFVNNISAWLDSN